MAWSTRSGQSTSPTPFFYHNLSASGESGRAVNPGFFFPGTRLPSAHMKPMSSIRPITGTIRSSLQSLKTWFFQVS